MDQKGTSSMMTGPGEYGQMSLREIPRNRKGVQDEWGAMVALQNEIAAKGEVAKKLQNK